jgi:hypothetical protein
LAVNYGEIKDVGRKKDFVAVTFCKNSDAFKFFDKLSKEPINGIRLHVLYPVEVIKK